MKQKYGQERLSRTNIYFDLKAIKEAMTGSKVFVLTDMDFMGSYPAEYFDELGLELTVVSGEVSNDFESVRGLAEEFRNSKASLIIAAGSGAVINAGKAVKLFSCLDLSGDLLGQIPPEKTVPMLAVPMTVETGLEANGLVTLITEEGPVFLHEKAARPDYLLLDSSLLSYKTKESRNEGLAGAISLAINILWTVPEDSRAAELALDGLNILLDHTMEYLRDEKSVQHDMQTAAFRIGKAAGRAGVLKINKLVYAVSDLCGISPYKAAIRLQDPLALVMEQRFVGRGITSFDKEEMLRLGVDVDAELTDDEKALFDKLQFVSGIFVEGRNRLNVLHRQISFIEGLLEIEPPEDPEESVIRQFAEELDRDAFSDWPAKLDDDEIFFMSLQIFNMVPVWYFVETCERRINKRQGILNRTMEQYGEEFYPEKIIKDPFYIRRMDRRAFVKGLQALTLETLVLTRDFLNEHGLRFYLSEGTLLGAARHRGFIPWDDDVDIMMPREDYDELVRLDAEGKIPPELNFDALENNPKHWVLGAKMQLTKPTQYIQHKVTNLSKYNGPYVDIFPLDYWNRPFTRKQFRAQRIVKMCRRLLFMKTGYSKKTKKKFHRKLMRMAVPFIPQRFIAWLAIRNMKKYFDGKRRVFVHLCSYYPFYKEVFPVGMFGEPVTLQFEGYDMPVPVDYDFMLRTIYGDSYDKIPPQTVTKMRRHAFELIVDDEEAADVEPGDSAETAETTEKEDE